MKSLRSNHDDYQGAKIAYGGTRQIKEITEYFYFETMQKDHPKDPEPNLMTLLKL